MSIDPSVTMNELIFALATSNPLSDPTSAPQSTLTAKLAAHPRCGCSPTANMPPNVMTEPMDRSSCPHTSTNVNPAAAGKLSAVALRMLAMLPLVWNSGVSADIAAQMRARRR